MPTASRITHAAVAISMAVSTFAVGVPTSVAATFSDVPSSHEFFTFVEKLVSLGAVSGQGGVFRINDNLTRAELCKMVVIAAELPLQSGGLATFSDVPQTHSLYAYVETAARAGVVGGFGGGLFLPDAPVTRGQSAKIIAGGFKLQLNTTNGPHFYDVPSGNVFYAYVETLYNSGVVGGIGGGLFGVDLTVTRGQVAKMVAKSHGASSGDETVDETPSNSNIVGLTTDQTSQCVLDRITTKKDVANNIIVQAYTSGKNAQINQPLGVIVKVTDLGGRPVPGLSLRMEVTEGSSGTVSTPSEVGRSGVYLGSYTSTSSGSSVQGGRVSLLISESSSNYSRAQGYEDVKAFPPVSLSFQLLQGSRVGSVSKVCWDLTRKTMTIDPNISSNQLDDYIIIIGLAEDGNDVGVSTGITMNLFSTGESSTTNSPHSYAGGFYVYRYQPYNYSSSSTVAVKKKSDHMLQIITDYRVLSSDQMKTEVTIKPRD